MKDIILVIDDDTEFLDLIKDFCLKRRFRGGMMYFVDAFEAMQFIVKNQDNIQIVFTDYNMKEKGMNGSIIVEKCKELNIDVFVVTSDIKLLHSPGQLQVIEKISSLSRILAIIAASL